MTNIYDTANQLERELRELPEFKALSEASANIKADAEADKLFTEFKAFQENLHQKMMTGEMPSEDDQKEMQEMGTKVQANALIGQLMEKEQAFSLVMNDINKIIMLPIHEIYAD
ncbi:MAG: YlbF/YmcA family competence regulator [Lactobacillales bacterium]|jgi:cell fate (sporulation/competence/biofilm development) regulator YlbF (YheA/YmcA/DUF963 family)|nr:YlbF/YmcA family competence regulator [Lactobacillales bacterium]